MLTSPPLSKSTTTSPRASATASASAKEQFANGWSGRNTTKDDLRRRIWQSLADSGDANDDDGSPFHKIPNFVGAKEAAEQLRSLSIWKAAKIVKSNPDPPQAWIRKCALEDGKRVYVPVPCLTHDFPFLLLDPIELSKQNLTSEDVMYSDGAMKHGQRVQFSQMEVMDICVVGSVAVSKTNGARTGKGGGFADLELGIFRHYKTFLPGVTPVVTTVHPLQVVDYDNIDKDDDDDHGDHGDIIMMEDHDTPLDYVITPTEVFKTNNKIYPQPGPLDWKKLRQDQYDNIPFLKALRLELEK